PARKGGDDRRVSFRRSALRNVVRGLDVVSGKTISIAPDCLDHLSGRAQLGSETLNVHIHCPGLHVRLSAPYRLEEMLAPLSESAAVYHKKEKSVFSWRKSNVHTSNTHPVSWAVNDNGANRISFTRDSRSACPAQNRADSQNQLVRVEGLGQIVICAKRETLDAVRIFAQGCEHQKGAVPSARVSAQCGHHVESRHVGKHEVEKNEGYPSHSSLFDRFLTGKGC